MGAAEVGDIFEKQRLQHRIFAIKKFKMERLEKRQ